MIPGWLACSIASLACGLAAAQALRLRLSRAEALCIAYVLGSAILSMLTLTLSLAMLARKSIFLSLAVLSLPLLYRGIRWLKTCEPFSLKNTPAFATLLFAAGFTAYAALSLRQALTPDTSPDAMAYHLGFVNLWNHAHGMTRLPDMYAGMPHGMEMLFLYAFTIGRYSAADLVHFNFLLILPWLMLLYARRFQLPAGAGPLAAIVVFATPLVGWDGAVAYNDVALATVLFTAFYLLQMWRKERAPGALPAAGIAAGFAFAIKYTAIFGLIFLALLAIFELTRRRKPEWRAIIAPIALAACFIAPYLIRNAVWYGDPVFPFFNAVFPNPFFHLANERDYVKDQSHVNNVTWSELPKELTIGGPKLPESLGPLYVLLAPLALAGIAWARTRPLALGFLLLASACLANNSPRFLIPALPFGALAAFSVTAKIPRAGFALVCALAAIQLALCWPDVIQKLGTPRGERPSQTPWRVIFRAAPDEDFLARTSAQYLMARAIDRYVPENGGVFAMGGGFTQAYTSHFVFDGYHSAQAEWIDDLFLSAADSPRFDRRVFHVAFPATTVARLEIVQRGASATTKWNVGEIQLFLHGVPLSTLNPFVTADPNPWDARFAADGRAATRWRSWDTMRPGMRLDLRYPSSPIADRIEIDCGEGQWDSDMQIRIQNAQGQWIAPTTGAWEVTPAVDLRKPAMAELKRRGIGYVIVANVAWRAEQYNGNPGAWGLSKIFTNGAGTLYRIE